MEILLSHISDEETLFEFEEPSSAFDLPCEFGPVKAEIGIYTLGSRYFAHGTVASKVTSICDICLESYTATLQESFELFIEPESIEDERHIAEDAEVLVLEAQAASVDFNAFFRELLLLTMPLQKRCRPDCKGLCPVCGANQNRITCHHDEEHTDPRWDKLKKIKDKLENLEN